MNDELKYIIDRWLALPVEERESVREEAEEFAERALTKFLEAAFKASEDGKISRRAALSAVKLVLGNLEDDEDTTFETSFKMAVVASIGVILKERENKNEKGKEGEGRSEAAKQESSGQHAPQE